MVLIGKGMAGDSWSCHDGLLGAKTVMVLPALAGVRHALFTRMSDMLSVLTPRRCAIRVRVDQAVTQSVIIRICR